MRVELIAFGAGQCFSSQNSNWKVVGFGALFSEHCTGERDTWQVNVLSFIANNENRLVPWVWMVKERDVFCGFCVADHMALWVRDGQCPQRASVVCKVIPPEGTHLWWVIPIVPSYPAQAECDGIAFDFVTWGVCLYMVIYDCITRGRDAWKIVVLFFI